MPRNNPLSKAITAQKKASKRKAAPAPAAPAADAAPRTQQASRIGRVMIGAHFPPAVQRELKIIAAMEGINLQTVLAKSFDMMLASYGRPQIAASGLLESKAEGKTAAA